MHDLKIGDRIVFLVQGIPVEAKISSIRSPDQDFLKPFLLFVFQEDTLGNAPRRRFLPPFGRFWSDCGPLNEIVMNFPTSDIQWSMTATIATLRHFPQTVQRRPVFYGLGILAGLLITVFDLGHPPGQGPGSGLLFGTEGRIKLVVKVFGLENLIIGSLSGILAASIFPGRHLDHHYKSV
ncbi:MAG: hypothetical protein U5R30_18280 [Deltaproteobacteria bacterium]|nr:hypothetical protein [Deltaproteobacteria bacterium]